MPQRYDKYKIKATLLFSIIICLFATNVSSLKLNASQKSKSKNKQTLTTN